MFGGGGGSRFVSKRVVAVGGGGVKIETLFDNRGFGGRFDS